MARAKMIKVVEAVPGKLCLCGCGAPPRSEGGFWAANGCDHRALMAVVREFGGTANLIASIGIMASKIAASNREAKKAKAAKARGSK